MSRRPALLTQAEVRRAIAAAKQAGADHVDVLPDGTIRIGLAPALAGEDRMDQSGPKKELTF